MSLTPFSNHLPLVFHASNRHQDTFLHFQLFFKLAKQIDWTGRERLRRQSLRCFAFTGCKAANSVVVPVKGGQRCVQPFVSVADNGDMTVVGSSDNDDKSVSPPVTTTLHALVPHLLTWDMGSMHMLMSH